MAIVAALFVGVIFGWMGREVLAARDHHAEKQRRFRWQPTKEDLKGMDQRALELRLLRSRNSKVVPRVRTDSTPVNVYRTMAFLYETP